MTQEYILEKALHDLRRFFFDEQVGVMFWYRFGHIALIQRKVFCISKSRAFFTAIRRVDFLDSRHGFLRRRFFFGGVTISREICHCQYEADQPTT